MNKEEYWSSVVVGNYSGIVGDVEMKVWILFINNKQL